MIDLRICVLLEHTLLCCVK